MSTSILFLDIEIDKQKEVDLAQAAIRYYRKGASERDGVRRLQDIENRWYLSLKNNTPNYSLYNEICMIGEVWACWSVYSKRYLNDIQKDKSLTSTLSVYEYIKYFHNIQSVLDLGCGTGLTTARLKGMFPDSIVFGTQIKESCQYKIAEEFGKIYNFNIVQSVNGLTKIDFVFASEYFEHIERPIEHLENIINKCSPKFFLIANSFNTTSMGHFITYKDRDKNIDQKEVGKLFSKRLKELGYEKMKTKLWNNRPSFWRKVND